MLPGNDIDTDRIIPARFLRELSFENLGPHAFADDREAAAGSHPLDDPRYRGARILIVGRNFGCGSSREHAPQALWRFGFQAFVGDSFAEIFFGNCTSLGLPCVTLRLEAIAALRARVEANPSRELEIDLAAEELRTGGESWAVEIAEGARAALCDGTWDATGVLLAGGDRIEKTARRVPYLQGFAERSP